METVKDSDDGCAGNFVLADVDVVVIVAGIAVVVVVDWPRED